MQSRNILSFSLALAMVPVLNSCSSDGGSDAPAVESRSSDGWQVRADNATISYLAEAPTVQARATDPDLLAHWPLEAAAVDEDGNLMTPSTVPDASGNAHAGNVQDQIGAQAAMIGSGLYFPGDLGEVEPPVGGVVVPGFLQDGLPDAFAVSLWARFDQSTVDPSWGDFFRFFSCKSSWNASQGFELEYVPDPEDRDIEGEPLHPHLRFIASGGEVLYSSEIDLADTWHHIAVSKGADDNLRVYVDGEVIIDDQLQTALQTPTTDFVLGRNAGEHGHFVGVLDEVEVYSRALDADDVATQLNERRGLVASWSFDEGAGTIAVDAGPLGLDAELSGSSTWLEDGAVGGALRLDGASGMAVVADSGTELAVTGTLSIAGFLRLDPDLDRSLAGSMRIVSKKSLYADPNGYEFEYDSIRNRLSLSAGGPWFAYADGVDLLDGSWHHVAVVVDGIRARFYLDGVALTTSYEDADYLAPLRAGERDLAIGRLAGDGFGYLAGDLDELRIYDIALDAAAVTDLANGNVAVNAVASR